MQNNSNYNYFKQNSLQQSVTFTGKSGEYFKIWIVNLALTIITLGIYSPWAKVRRLKYFYNNTWVSGANFDFTANPIKILKGRLLLVFLYFAIAMGLKIASPMQGSIVTIIIYALIVPWIIIKSRSFRLRNTTYQGVRFNFFASYSAAFTTFLLYPLSFLTLGLLKPYELRQRGKLLINNSRFGGNFFYFDAGNSKFSKLLLIAMSPIIMLSVLVSSVIFGKDLFSYIFGSVLKTLPTYYMSLIIPVAFIAYLGIFVVIYGFIFACRTEYLNNTYFEIDSNVNSASNPDNNLAKISCTATVTKYLLIIITNCLAIILTLGLLYPWTKIRLHKYKMETIKLNNLNISKVRGVLENNSQAIADEADDFFDLDFGI